MIAFVPACPAVADGSDAFERGVESARADDYEAAIAHFRAARAAGLDTPALDFNLGVALYRLGRLADAIEPFRRAAASTEMAGPAAYNLGRIARERGDIEAATRWFQQSAKRARTDAVRQQALAALGTTDPPLRLIGSVGAGLGYDSNIALAPSESAVASRESDQRAFADASVQYSLDDHWHLFAAGYAEQYRTADEFDLSVLQTGVDWRHRSWADHRVSLRHTRFGGEPFENAAVWYAFAEQEVGSGSLEMSVSVAKLRGASGYSYLDGHRWSLQGTWSRRALGGRWSLVYDFSYVDRDDLTAGDSFFSYSYRKHGLSMGYRRALGGGLSLTLNGHLARYRYHDDEIHGGDTLDRRDEPVLRLAAEVAKQLDGGWRLAVRLEGDERRSNIDDYGYERTVINARIAREF